MCPYVCPHIQVGLCVFIGLFIYACLYVFVSPRVLRSAHVCLGEAESLCCAKPEFWGHMAWGPILVLPLAGGVSLGHFRKLSETQFFICKVRIL